MSYDRQHLYLTFGGPLAADEWTTGLHFAHPEGGGGDHNITAAEWTALLIAEPLTAMKTAIVTWFKSGSSGSGIGALAKLSWVKLAWRDISGHYLADPMLVEFTPEAPPVATPHPPQVSYVISLRSGSGFGAANYGRMYCPPPFWLVGQNNGLASSTEISNAVTAAKTMINACKSTLATTVTGIQPVIMSTKGPGTTKVITQLGIGQALDTQRRRRNKMSDAVNLVGL